MKLQNADPYEERTCDPGRLHAAVREQAVEDDQVADEEGVEPRQQLLALEAFGQPAEQRHQCQHAQEDRAEQLVDGPRAQLDGHFVA